MTRPTRLARPERGGPRPAGRRPPGRRQPGGNSAVVAPAPWWTHDPAGVATKTAVVFRADDGTHAGLWATDGSPRGAVFLGVNPPNATGSVPNPVAVGDRVFFFSGPSGYELWTTDGRPAGTRRVTPFPFRGFDSFARDAVAVNGRFVFATDDYGPNGRAKLFASDGTAAGTQVIAELAGGVGTRFVTDGRFAYYAVNRHDPGTGFETATIYQTDGTRPGRGPWPPCRPGPASTSRIPLPDLGRGRRLPARVHGRQREDWARAVVADGLGAGC